MKRGRLTLLWLVFWLMALAGSAQIPARPEPPRLVNDLAGLLSRNEISSLEETLVAFDRETSTQVVVVTVKSLEGYDRADFAFRLGESWGVGQKGKNNGIVVLVKPKTERETGQVFIAVGYGLEGVIPDAVANRQIVQNEMIPRFKENNYYAGITNGVKVIMDLSRGEYTAAEYSGSGEGPGVGMGIIVLLLFLIFIIVPVMTSKNKVYNTGKRDVPLWLLLSMMNGKKNHGGHWDDFSSGRGSFGGGGLGGFGGFGGGSFGGGGAGGSW